MRLWFLDVLTNHGPRCPVLAVYRKLGSNLWGLAGNLSDPTVASSQYDILLCSQTVVSDIRHVSQLLVTEHIANPNLNVVVAKLFLGFVV